MIPQRFPAASLVLVCAISSFTLPAVDSSAAIQATFHVSPAGDDANPGTESKPFATLERAQKAVRTLNATMTGDIEVVLKGGVYPIDRTLVLESRDSGNGGHRIVYRAAVDQTPIISGGKLVTHWTPDRNGRWKAPAPVDDTRQLYVNGRRGIRAQGQVPSGIKLNGADGYVAAAPEMAQWRNPADMEMTYMCRWDHSRCKVAALRRDGANVLISMAQPAFAWILAKEGIRYELPNTIENALELVDEPGEWYLDRPARMIYYIPRPGEDMKTAHAVVPAVERLLELRGTLDEPVHDIRFEGITFAYATWLRPSQTSFVHVQANFCLRDPRKRAQGLSTVHCEELKSPANIVCRVASRICFERCNFTRLGGAGLDLEFGSRDNVVSGCRFFELAGSGIQIGDVLKDDHHPDDPRKIVRNNTVRNCCIHDVCQDYWGGIGIFIGYAQQTKVQHNEIANVPYSGISVGWGWGEVDAGGNGNYEQTFKYETPTPARDNLIEDNYVHHALTKMEEGNAIYALACMPGTIIRRNHIHDSGGSYGGIGLDEGSSRIEVAGNVVYRAKTLVSTNPPDLKTCNIHDNYFVAPDDAKAPKDVQTIIATAGLESAYRDLSKQSDPLASGKDKLRP